MLEGQPKSWSILNSIQQLVWLLTCAKAQVASDFKKGRWASRAVHQTYANTS